MRAAIRIALIALIGLAVASAGLLASSSEVRDTVLLKVSPTRFRETVFLQFTNTSGETIFLLGTIHDAHLTTPEYSLKDVQSVVANVRPDVLLIESRPEELARGNWCDGPIEMGVAALTARNAGMQVAGFDWWTMNAAHEISDEGRENRMFDNIRHALTGRHSLLILTGYSHFDGFERRLASLGFHSASADTAQTDRFFDSGNRQFRFPRGMAGCVERRIAVDEQAVAQAPDDFWKSRIESTIEARKRFLAFIVSTGES